MEPGAGSKDIFFAVFGCPLKFFLKEKVVQSRAEGKKKSLNSSLTENKTELSYVFVPLKKSQTLHESYSSGRIYELLRGGSIIYVAYV